jgi:NADPH:quinone reductase-like Zn-dependent oxidoreductase
MGDTMLSIRSTLHEGGGQPYVELLLVESALRDLTPEKPDHVLIRVEASPINPSDLGGFLAGMNRDTARAAKDANGNPVIRGDVTPAAFASMQARAGVPVPVGNEAAGTVVATGDSEAATALLGKKVACLGGAMYAEYRRVSAAQCLELLPGTTPAQGASAFVNPLTVLGMVETMRDEGHTAIVHTAAASQLGQMLVRLCAAEDIPLVNVVRRQEQAELLRGLAAECQARLSLVVVSSADGFEEALADACEAAGATLGFDATGGGTLASQLLTAMEVATTRKDGAGAPGNRYGSSTFKQVCARGSPHHHNLRSLPLLHCLRMMTKDQYLPILVDLMAHFKCPTMPPRSLVWPAGASAWPMPQPTGVYLRRPRGGRDAALKVVRHALGTRRLAARCGHGAAPQIALPVASCLKCTAIIGIPHQRCVGPSFLERVGEERAEAARQRVAAEITTTFATAYRRACRLSGCWRTGPDHCAAARVHPRGSDSSDKWLMAEPPPCCAAWRSRSGSCWNSVTSRPTVQWAPAPSAPPSRASAVEHLTRNSPCACGNYHCTTRYLVNPHKVDATAVEKLDDIMDKAAKQVLSKL